MILAPSSMVLKEGDILFRGKLVPEVDLLSDHPLRRLNWGPIAWYNGQSIEAA
jgi:hypothetical protein